METIDQYMAKVHAIMADTPKENEGFVSTVRKIINRIAADWYVLHDDDGCRTYIS